MLSSVRLRNQAFWDYAKRDGMAGTVLENPCGRKATVGSNPTPSARNPCSSSNCRKEVYGILFTDRINPRFANNLLTH